MCVFQSDLKWLMLLCFPCCRRLPCCRNKTHLLAGSRMSRYHHQGGGGGGPGRADGARGGSAHSFDRQRRFTESAAVYGDTARHHLHKDTRRSTTVGPPPAHGGRLMTTYVTVYRPPTTPPPSDSGVRGPGSNGNAKATEL